MDLGTTIHPSDGPSRKIKSYCFTDADCANELYVSKCNLATKVCTNSHIPHGIDHKLPEEPPQGAVLNGGVRQSSSAYQICQCNADCTYRGAHICDRTTNTCVSGYPKKRYANALSALNKMARVQPVIKEESRLNMAYIRGSLFIAMCLIVAYAILSRR